MSGNDKYRTMSEKAYELAKANGMFDDEDGSSFVPPASYPKPGAYGGYGGYGGGYGGGSYVTTVGPRCHASHPKLKLGTGLLSGGACGDPHAANDVYVALDEGSVEFIPGALPWRGEAVQVMYPISDMQAPKNAEEFKAMIAWLADRLNEGKKVHVGCIGGHGRTGTVFVALVKHMLGIDDAITYVRKHYCKKAVESTSQIEFLHTHFGVKKVSATKGFDLTPSKGASWYDEKKGQKPFGFVKGAKQTASSGESQHLPPVTTKANIWGGHAKPVT